MISQDRQEFEVAPETKNTFPEIPLERAFCALYPYYLFGGMLPWNQIKAPLGIENGNICILQHDPITITGEAAVKLGWGDFNLKSPEAGPEQLKSLGGPVFVLKQFGAYMLDQKNYQKWQNRPRPYLFSQAAFIIYGDKIYAPLDQEQHIMAADKDLATKIKFVDFNDPKFQASLPAIEPHECLRRLLTQLVIEKITPEVFENLLDQLKGEQGDQTFKRLKRIYDRWLDLTSSGFTKESFKPQLYPGETPWKAEMNVGEFTKNVRELINQYKTEHGLKSYDLLPQEVKNQLAEQALKEFDPQVFEELQFAKALQILFRTSLYSRDQILDLGTHWDRKQKTFI